MTNISKIAQILGVASEGEAEIGIECMIPCTMIHSNFSICKLIRCKVTTTNLISLPISPSYALHNFSQNHCITSAHMERLDDFLGSRKQPSPCLSLVSSLATTRFTENTSRSSLSALPSHDSLVTS